MAAARCRTANRVGLCGEVRMVASPAVPTADGSTIVVTTWVVVIGVHGSPNLNITIDNDMLTIYRDSMCVKPILRACGDCQRTRRCGRVMGRCRVPPAIDPLARSQAGVKKDPAEGGHPKLILLSAGQTSRFDSSEQRV